MNGIIELASIKGLTIGQVKRILDHLPNLSTLIMTSIKVESFLDKLESRPNIQTLVLNNCSLWLLRGLCCFPELRVLECPNNLLVSLYGSHHCPKLTRINARSNQLKTLCMSNPELEDLDCSSNRLFEFDSLHLCPKLHTLNADHNNIRHLVLHSCPSLRTVSLNNCKLRTLGNLHDLNLESLSVNSNLIQTVRPSEPVFSLKKLYCSSGRLAALRGIGLYPNLEELVVSGNTVHRVGNIWLCSKLAKLDITANCMSNLVSVFRIESLLEAKIQGNPLKNSNLFSNVKQFDPRSRWYKSANYRPWVEALGFVFVKPDGARI